ncbi:MAG: sugar phosphate isomerase/epimerase [Clostridia bacterium]|nr:sugar phosphate isomerase/epimerase [Clostridia bacterium]
MGLKIGVQVYSVRDSADRDLKDTLKKIKAMGYEGVELAGLYGNKPEDVRKMLDETGLVAISAHVPLQELVLAPEGVIKNYVTIGCRYIAVPYLPEELRPGKKDFEKTLKDIEMIAKECKKQGIQLLYHNHNFEFVKMENGEYGLDRIYSTISEDLLKSEIDTCWVHVSGVDPAAYVKKYSGRAPIVHFKDYNGFVSDQMYELIGIAPKEKKAEKDEKHFEFRPVGCGVLDFPAIIREAEAAGTQWIVVEQDEPSMGLTRLESIERSRENLKKLLG